MRRLLSNVNRRTMLKGMAGLHNTAAGALVGRIVRLGLLGGLRSIEIDREEFRRQLGKKHGLWVSGFAEMHLVPTERLDAIAKELIRETERMAMVEGAGFGFGGMITVVPDAGVLTFLTLRLIQKLCLLYGFQERGRSDRLELWMAAAAAAGVDYGKDLAGKQVLEKIAPRIAERLAVKLGQEAAQRWVCRLIPFASSAIGGALNFSFVRGWGRRVQRNLRARHIAAQPVSENPPPAYSSAQAVVV